MNGFYWRFPQASPRGPSSEPTKGVCGPGDHGARSSYGSSSGRLGGRPSPDDWPVSLRPIRGQQVLPREPDVRVRRMIQPGGGVAGIGACHLGILGFVAERLPHGLRDPAVPLGGQGAAGPRPTGAGRPASPPRTGRRPRRRAPLDRSSMIANSASILAAGTAPAPGPDGLDCASAPAAPQFGASRSTACVSRSRTRAMSHLGRSVSLSPPTSVITSAPWLPPRRPARRRSARSASWRTARFAYLETGGPGGHPGGEEVGPAPGRSRRAAGPTCPR